MAYFWTSDTHWGHKGIIKHMNRPFVDVDAMSEAMIERWNSVVGPKDHIFHLGDLSFLKPEPTAAILRRLNGTKYWVTGNHDKTLIAKPPVTACFHHISAYAELKINLGNVEGAEPQRIVMSHYPMMTWNKSHYGSWMLHGHCHGSLRHPGSMKLMDVGADCNNLTPFSLDQITAYMAPRGITNLDHHQKREPQ